VSETPAWPLGRGLRALLLFTAGLNVAIGGLFLLAPETGFTPWPSPISPVLIRFIGAIIIGNGVGTFVAARQGTWEGARALLIVALVYGLIVLIAVPIQLIAEDVDRALWWYVAVDALFVGPIAWIVVTNERARGPGRR
jgi:hypothetical protein